MWWYSTIYTINTIYIYELPNQFNYFQSMSMNNFVNDASVKTSIFLVLFIMSNEIERVN
jgi:hypothetical protein